MNVENARVAEPITIVDSSRCQMVCRQIKKSQVNWTYVKNWKNHVSSCQKYNFLPQKIRSQINLKVFTYQAAHVQTVSMHVCCVWKMVLVVENLIVPIGKSVIGQCIFLKNHKLNLQMSHQLNFHCNYNAKIRAG